MAYIRSITYDPRLMVMGTSCGGLGLVTVAEHLRRRNWVRGGEGRSVH